MKNFPKDLFSIGSFLVVFFIALSVSLLIPASTHLSGSHPIPKRIIAKIEISALVQAIEAYHVAYGQMPVSGAVFHAAKSGSFTYGAVIPNPKSPIPMGTLMGGQVVLNSELIAVLMDLTNYPGNPDQSTINTNHCLNPQHTKFLNANFVAETSSGGVGPDLVYRDPWGTPYFITVNLSETNQCQDGFYFRPGLPATAQVMVWSAGPDKKINTSAPRGEAENKGSSTFVMGN